MPLTKRNSILNFFNSLANSNQFKILRFHCNCNDWSYWRWRRKSDLLQLRYAACLFSRVTCKFFSGSPIIVGSKATKTFSNLSIFSQLLLMYDLKNNNLKKTSGWLIRCADECSLLICLYIHLCLLSLMHWPAYWLSVWSPDFLTNWPVSSQIELTSWAMTTGWLKDSLIVCPTVCWILHLASGHGYN